MVFGTGGFIFSNRVTPAERAQINNVYNVISEIGTAESYEKDEDYHKAYELYSLVIPDDPANFKKAREKIDELDKRFEVNKIAALCYTILKDAHEVDSFDKLESVQVNVEDPQMTCMINGFGYCIMKFEAEKEYGGWFSSDMNEPMLFAMHCSYR